LRADYGLTGSFSESEGPLGHSGLLSPGNRRSCKYQNFRFRRPGHVLSAEGSGLGDGRD
jgi:hypothetical protein